MTFWLRRQRQQQILQSAKDHIVQRLATTDHHLETLRQATLAVRRALGDEQPPPIVERCRRAYTDCAENYREGWIVKLRLDYDDRWHDPDAWMSVAIVLEYAAVGMERALLHHEPFNVYHLPADPETTAITGALGAVAQANGACLSSVFDLIQEFRLWAARLVAA